MYSITENIPTINSINDITDETLERFMRDGFAYVKLPHLTVEDKLLKLEKEARKFFNQPQEIKEKNKLNPETLQGYIDKRKEGKKAEFVEQVTFPPKEPIGLFTDSKSELAEIHEVYYFKIVQPLLKAIFYKTLLPEGFSKEKIDSLLKEITEEIFFLMSLLFYPYNKDELDNKFVESEHIVQPEHVDEGLMTILWVGESGLQVWLDNDSEKSTGVLDAKEGVKGAWYNIAPKPGHVVVNLGKALPLLLSGKCNAIKHRVVLPNKERFSIGIFYNPPSTYKFRDLVEDKILFDGSYEKYIRDYFSKPASER